MNIKNSFFINIFYLKYFFRHNKSKSGEPNYEKFFINKHNEIVAHFESKHEFIAELLHEKMNEDSFFMEKRQRG